MTDIGKHGPKILLAIIVVVIAVLVIHHLTKDKSTYASIMYNTAGSNVSTTPTCDDLNCNMAVTASDTTFVKIPKKFLNRKPEMVNCRARNVDGVKCSDYGMIPDITGKVCTFNDDTFCHQTIMDEPLIAANRSVFSACTEMDRKYYSFVVKLIDSFPFLSNYFYADYSISGDKTLTFNKDLYEFMNVVADNNSKQVENLYMRRSDIKFGNRFFLDTGSRFKDKKPYVSDIINQMKAFIEQLNKSGDLNLQFNNKDLNTFLLRDPRVFIRPSTRFNLSYYNEATNRLIVDSLSPEFKNNELTIGKTLIIHVYLVKPMIENAFKRLMSEYKSDVKNCILKNFNGLKTIAAMPVESTIGINIAPIVGVIGDRITDSTVLEDATKDPQIVINKLQRNYDNLLIERNQLLAELNALKTGVFNK